MWLCRRSERRRRVAAGALLASLAALAWGSPDPSAQRDAYRAALEALSRDRWTEFERLKAGLDEYPLKPYLEAAAIERRLDRADPAEVDALVRAHPGVPPVERLRRHWLERLARERRHRELVDAYTPQSDAELRCAHLHARLSLGEWVLFEPDLWLTGRSRPDACDPVFAHYRANGDLTPDLYLARAKLAAGAGEGRFARWLSRRLEPMQRESIQRWVALAAHPERELARARHWPDSELHREMLEAALTRMASRRNDRAREHWEALRDRFAWSEASRAGIERELALYYATDYPPDALATLDRIPDPAVDAQILEWRARVALRAGDWSQVLAALDRLPEDRRGRPRWRYWRARALLAAGQPEPAETLFRDLAGEANYYGFLSADRIGHDYALCPETPRHDPALSPRLREIPALRRAFELYHLGELLDARREWNLANAGLGPDERRQLALLAAAEGWVDRAVLTLADTGHQQDYELRFPLHWEPLVQALAARERLNPSLIYGVMRSESALVTDAVSSAGAIGLMQLTPATARRVARDRGWPLPSRSQLNRPEYSIALGSAYLSELIERYGHPLAALAAYNAGPDAVERWRSLNLPAEADRWVETVPYYETRDYLARVIAFATIYDWRREGKMVPVKLRMPDLDVAPGRTDFGVAGSRIPRCPELVAEASK